MPTMNMIQALNSAMDVLLTRDPDVLIFGEDVGYFGGVFRATEGLQSKHGLERCFDTPIAEAGLIGIAVGMGAYGLRPIVEIQFADYIYPAYDQIVSEVARLRYRSAGQFTAPITIRSPYGGGIFGGQTHSQSVEALFTHVAGLKVVIPSNPYDAKGLLIAAVEEDDPVIFLEPKRIYNGPFDGHHDRPVSPWSKHPASEVPEGHYPCRWARRPSPGEGEAVTVLAYGTMVHVVLAAVEEAGVDAEVIDLRTLWPVDIEAIITSVKEDRPLRDRARGDPDLRFRRRTVGAGPGALLLSSGSSDRARGGVGHALSPRLRVGVFSRTGAHRGRAEADGGGVSVMAEFVFKLPDVGEGTAEAEIVAWHVAVGDLIEEDQPLVDVMTDKATVEMTTPVSGRVLALHGDLGEMAPVGSPLAVIEVEGQGETTARTPRVAPPPPALSLPSARPEAGTGGPPPPQGGRRKRNHPSSPFMGEVAAQPTEGAAPRPACRHKRFPASPTPSRWPRPWFAAAPRNSASACSSCRAPGRPGGSRWRTWKPTPPRL